WAKPQSFIYRAAGTKGRVRKGHVRREKVHARDMVIGTVMAGEYGRERHPARSAGSSDLLAIGGGQFFSQGFTCILQVIWAMVLGCPKGPRHLGVRPARSAFL